MTCQILFSRKNSASLSSAESAHSILSEAFLMIIQNTYIFVEKSGKCLSGYSYYLELCRMTPEIR